MKKKLIFRELNLDEVFLVTGGEDGGDGGDGGCGDGGCDAGSADAGAADGVGDTASAADGGFGGGAEA